MPAVLNAIRQRHRKRMRNVGDDSDEEGEGPSTTNVLNDKVPIEYVEPLEWVERMAISASQSLPSELSPDDDPKREEAFVRHALLSVAKGIEMLEAANVTWQRPDDYFAEMYKSDEHMSKVRDAIMRSKARVEERAQRTSMRLQKRFGKELQAETARERARQKREITAKVAELRRRHRGTTKEELNALIDRSQEGGRGRRGLQKSRSVRPGGEKKRPGKNRRIRSQ